MRRTGPQQERTRLTTGSDHDGRLSSPSANTGTATSRHKSRHRLKDSPPAPGNNFYKKKSNFYQKRFLKTLVVHAYTRHKTNQQKEIRNKIIPHRYRPREYQTMQICVSITTLFCNLSRVLFNGRGSVYMVYFVSHR